MNGAYRIIGVESSPYTIKVRAVLRYRRLPYQWICRFPRMIAETGQVRPAIMPVVQFPDGSYRTDSTPILYDLEWAFPKQRSIIPEDAGQAWVSHLIEDMADEWLAKCIFHYRFGNERDSWYAARWVMSDAKSSAEMQSLAEEVAAFRAHQISRMPRFGCTPENAPVIEASYRRVLAIVESFAGNERYLFGSKPALADFGLYGPLKTLATDPTPSAIMREIAPNAEHWVRRLDDASGVDGNWDPAARALSPAVTELLRMAGELYLPFLDANARAIEDGSQTVRVKLGGSDYSQPVFRYQQKCLYWLRAEFEAMSPEARDRLRPALEATGCWRYLAGAEPSSHSRSA